MMQKREIERVQQICLGILRDVDRVCREHNIEYSLCGGSVIGAHLYQGILPWDDDIDLMMTRDNYELFVKTYPLYADERYQLVHHKSAKMNQIRTVFAKVMAKSTPIEENLGATSCFGNVFIDVSVFDRVPTKRFHRMAMLYSSYIYSLIYKYYGMVPGTKWKGFLFRTIFRFSTEDNKIIDRCSKVDDFCKKYQKRKSMYYAELLAPYASQIKYDAAIFSHYRDIEFSGMQIRIVKDYKDYLKTRYGKDDFTMEKPVHDKQHSHVLALLDKDYVESEKTAAVVVTYNKKMCLRKNIEALLKQTYRLNCIYVIDNCSSDGTDKYVHEMRTQAPIPIKYYRSHKNTGGSGGFSFGVRKAYEEGYDFIWGMDDDAYPEADALEKLFEKRKEVRMPAVLWSNNDGDNHFKNGIRQVNLFTFVGFLLPRQVIREVGFPRNDMMIYFDDWEYSYRIECAGYPCYKVQNSLIEHKRDKFIRKKVLGVSLKIINLPDWCVYYFMRNYLLVYPWCDARKYKVLFYKTPIHFMRIIINNPAQMQVAIKGIIDGIRGKSGIRYRPERKNQG